MMEKISSLRRASPAGRQGPLPNNSKRFQRMGPTPSLVLERWRRFPILEIARVVRTPSALIASGGRNFLLTDNLNRQNLPSRRGRWEVRVPSEKRDEPSQTSEADSNRLQSCPAASQTPPEGYLPTSFGNTPFLSARLQVFVGRASLGGGRFCR